MYGQKDLWGGLTDNYRKRISKIVDFETPSVDYLGV
jgi:hypothetical protein